VVSDAGSEWRGWLLNGSSWEFTKDSTVERAGMRLGFHRGQIRQREMGNNNWEKTMEYIDGRNQRTVGVQWLAKVKVMTRG